MISLWSLLLTRYLSTERGLHLTDTLASWCRRPGGVFLLLIPVLLVRTSLRNVFTGWNSEAYFVEYLVFFVIGYFLPADKRFYFILFLHRLPQIVLRLLDQPAFGTASKGL
jgi:hypothetical protein